MYKGALEYMAPRVQTHPHSILLITTVINRSVKTKVKAAWSNNISHSFNPRATSAHFEIAPSMPLPVAVSNSEATPPKAGHIFHFPNRDGGEHRSVTRP